MSRSVQSLSWTPNGGRKLPCALTQLAHVTLIPLSALTWCFPFCTRICPGFCTVLSDVLSILKSHHIGDSRMSFFHGSVILGSVIRGREVHCSCNVSLESPNSILCRMCRICVTRSSSIFYRGYLAFRNALCCLWHDCYCSVSVFAVFPVVYQTPLLPLPLILSILTAFKAAAIISDVHCPYFIFSCAAFSVLQMNENRIKIILTSKSTHLTCPI